MQYRLHSAMAASAFDLHEVAGAEVRDPSRIEGDRDAS